MNAGMVVASPLIEGLRMVGVSALDPADNTVL
jgi:hypothetical protein